MQTNPPVHCINVENIKMLNNIWKIFLLPSFATNHPPITFTIATLLKHNKEMKYITIKITLIPSVKKVHTQKNTSVSKSFEKSFWLLPVQTIIWFLCKPPSHQCHYAIAFTQTFRSFHCSLARENVNNSLFKSETYQFWLAAKYCLTLYNNFTFSSKCS